jgi:hypothetical protein
MDPLRFKLYYYQKIDIPYLKNDEWAKINDTCENFKDQILKLYFEEVDTMDRLIDFFHPTNDANQFIYKIPGLKDVNLSPRNTSPQAFSRTYDLFETLVKLNAEEYFVLGGEYLAQMSIDEMFTFMKYKAKYRFQDEENATDSYTFHMDHFLFMDHLRELLTIFDHLPQKRLKKIYKGLHYAQKEFDEVKLIDQELLTSFKNYIANNKKTLARYDESNNKYIYTAEVQNFLTHFHHRIDVEDKPLQFIPEDVLTEEYLQGFSIADLETLMWRLELRRFNAQNDHFYHFSQSGTLELILETMLKKI